MTYQVYPVVKSLPSRMSRHLLKSLVVALLLSIRIQRGMHLQDYIYVVRTNYFWNFHSSLIKISWLLYKLRKTDSLSTSLISLLSSIFRRNFSFQHLCFQNQGTGNVNNLIVGYNLSVDSSSYPRFHFVLGLNEKLYWLPYSHHGQVKS